MVLFFAAHKSSQCVTTEQYNTRWNETTKVFIFEWKSFPVSVSDHYVIKFINDTSHQQEKKNVKWKFKTLSSNNPNFVCRHINMNIKSEQRQHFKTNFLLFFKKNLWCICCCSRHRRRFIVILNWKAKNFSFFFISFTQPWIKWH